jgi:hypothetical protein
LGSRVANSNDGAIFAMLANRDVMEESENDKFLLHQDDGDAQ